TDKKLITLETLAGIKTLELEVKDGKVARVKVDMGAPILEGKLIPVTIDKPQVVNEPVLIEDVEFKITCVSMGNPHCVIFVNDVANLPLEKIGIKFEIAPYFPERVNTEFAELVDDHTVMMRVWERGSGETLACGTGACAVAVAGVLNGLLRKNEEITVILRGGQLSITVTDETVFMTGTAEKVFEGEIEF
ncbi:MAG TPA: diaminopimelate epimerase, partial [Clostridia bacterium]|nr:diaminopimelate epimerase [Clostridia bacterium]